MTVVSRAAALFATAWLLSAPLAWGEPYLAVFKGMHCSTCHSNSTGGGMRNSYGNIFSQTELAARRLGADVDKDLWSGAVTKWLSVARTRKEPGGPPSTGLPGSIRSAVGHVRCPLVGSDQQIATVRLEQDEIRESFDIRIYPDAELTWDSYEVAVVFGVLDHDRVAKSLNIELSVPAFCALVVGDIVVSWDHVTFAIDEDSSRRE